MFIIKLNKHDRYLQMLYEQIKGNYDHIDTNVCFSNSKRKIAEVDIIGKKGKTIDIYEVKCSYRISKAKKQLRRIKRILNEKRINLFFFCGQSLQLEEIVL